jgi:hypothetical protein
MVKFQINKTLVGICSGLGTSVLLVLIFQFFDWTRSVTMDGYFITRPITECIHPVFIGFFILSGIALSFLKANSFLIALGMILPFPLGFIVEVIVDPTSHNLFPFEVIGGWIPGFIIALIAIRLGKFIQNVTQKENT